MDKAPSRHFLGVERSALGRAWRDRLDERANARALAMVQRHGMPELLARVLAGRNVEVEEAAAYPAPTVRRLMPDPHVLTAMETAAARIADAAGRGESVAIFGDYDVDGATASAVLAGFSRRAGLPPTPPAPARGAPRRPWARGMGGPRAGSRWPRRNGWASTWW